MVRDGLADDLERWRLEHRVPGAALAVVGPGDHHRILLSGVADELSGTPLRSDHRFQIGSISKVVTALTVLRAVDAGQMRLDDPVVRHVPWFRAGPWTRAITVHHLLSHQAGLPIGPDWSDASAFDVWALRELDVQRPGDRYWYSNVGYKTLALTLGSVWGQDLPDLQTREVLRPLGMAEAVARVGATDPARDATGHEPQPERYPRSIARRVPAPQLVGTMGDGNILASIDDAAELAAGLLRLCAAKGTLVSTRGASALFGRQVPVGRGRWYGYGLGLETVRGRLRFGHGGDMPGFRSSLIADAEADVAVVVLSIFRGAPTRDLAWHALDAATWRGSGGPAALALRPTVDPRVAGRYRDDDGEAELRLTPTTATFVTEGIEHSLRALDAMTFEGLDPSFGRHHLAVRPPSRGRAATLTIGARRMSRADGDRQPPPLMNGRAAALDGTYRSSDPWARSVEVLGRGGRPWLVDDEGSERALVRVARDRYRLGREPNPERLVADAWVDGRPLRLTISGRPVYRDA